MIKHKRGFLIQDYNLLNIIHSNKFFCYKILQIILNHDSSYEPILTFARFPSEMAYGIHLIQIAKGFLENGFEVNVYYPKTYNLKTIYEEPSLYYGVDNKIKFKEVKNFDIKPHKKI